MVHPSACFNKPRGELFRGGDVVARHRSVARAEREYKFITASSRESGPVPRACGGQITPKHKKYLTKFLWTLRYTSFASRVISSSQLIKIALHDQPFGNRDLRTLIAPVSDPSST